MGYTVAYSPLFGILLQN